MTLAIYFFEQFLPPFVFGSVLFLFVLLLDKLFDIVDLIFNKGVSFAIVGKLFMLFIPTILPLTVPMAVLLACLVTFGRLSEENELSAVRSAGISLGRVLWLPPVFVFLLSLTMIPFNTRVAPWSNREFRNIYEKIMNADPLINVEARKFFSIKNIKLYCQSVDKKSNQLHNLFVYQQGPDGRVVERIFAQTGEIESSPELFTLRLNSGQVERFDPNVPQRVMHTAFGLYQISIPLNDREQEKITRFRNISQNELNKLIREMRNKGIPTGPLEAEFNMRYAIAFAPIALLVIGMPLATVLRRGGRGFSFGVSLIVIFTYYTLLVFGLTLAEKGSMPALLALWMGNLTCFIIGIILTIRLLRQ